MPAWSRHGRRGRTTNDVQHSRIVAPSPPPVTPPPHPPAAHLPPARTPAACPRASRISAWWQSLPDAQQAFLRGDFPSWLAAVAAVVAAVLAGITMWLGRGPKSSIAIGWGAWQAAQAA